MTNNLSRIITAGFRHIEQIYNEYTDGNIFVDQTFQRRSVWVEKNQIRLIETILMGYPMPEIFLWTQSKKNKGSRLGFSIVDGQQRLTAIREYIDGKFPLKKKHLDPDNKQKDFAGCAFKALSPQRKNQIWEYQLNTKSIPSDVDRPTIVKMFARLNETDKSLNPQELRHAEFNGEFMKTAEAVAELDYWEKWKAFSKMDIRRMRDIEFISGLLMFLRFGVEGDANQDAMDKAYELYNEKYKEAADDIKSIKKILSMCDEIFTNQANILKFFKKQLHFYPLFIVLYKAKTEKQTIKYSRLQKRLSEFISGYNKIDPKKPQASNVAIGIRRYRIAATEGTKKRQNRETRVLELARWLDIYSE